jgi:hypothetical protein
VCGAFVDFAVPLKQGGHKLRPARARCLTRARAQRGVKPRTDLDVFVFTCLPRKGTCPPQPTTTLAPATSTTSTTSSTTTSTTSSSTEAKRFLHARLAEDPKARTHRVAATRVTTADALVLYTLDAGDHGVQAHQGRVAALRHALGDVPLADLTRARLDALCRVWRTVRVDYPERDPRQHHLRPVNGATCNRLMATLRRARTLAIDKLVVELPRLTFPHFAEAPAGRYVSPEEFYAILSYFTDPTKGAFVELLYLLVLHSTNTVTYS